jgi:hypothetical protein
MTKTEISTSVSQKVPGIDTDGLVHKGLAQPGQTVTGHLYVQVLQTLCDSLRRPLGLKGTRFSTV